MAYATFSNALLPLAGTDAAAAKEARKPGFWMRLYLNMLEARSRAAEREIERYVRMYDFKRLPDAEISKRDLPFNH